MAVVVVVLLAGAVSACGDGNGGEESAGLEAAAAEVPPAVPPPPVIKKESPRWSREDWDDAMEATSEGVLVKPDGSEIRGWGDRRVRRYVTALFARMQHDFLTGNMEPVCRYIDSRLSTLVSGAAYGASCETTLHRYAQKLEKRGFKAPPLRFLWVRTYPGVAGIWVEDHRGRRFRVPFTQEGDSGWRLDLRELFPPEALGMPLQLKRPAAR